MMLFKLRDVFETFHDVRNCPVLFPHFCEATRLHQRIKTMEVPLAVERLPALKCA
jgi:hypothetical protein